MSIPVNSRDEDKYYFGIKNELPGLMIRDLAL